MRAMLRPESKIPDLMCELMSQASAPLRYRTCNVTGKMVEWTAAYREIFKTWAELEMLDRVPLAPGDGYEFVRPGEKAEEFDQYWDLTEQRWKYSIHYRSFTGKVGSGSQLVGPHRRRRNFVPKSHSMDIIVHLSQQEHVIVKQLARKQELSVSQVMIQGLRLYQASVHSTDNLPKKMEVESSAAGESSPINPEVTQEHGLANPATPTAAVGASAPDAEFKIAPIYDKHTDSLMIYLEDTPSFARRQDDRVTLFLDRTTESIVGVEVTGVKQLLCKSDKTIADISLRDWCQKSSGTRFPEPSPPAKLPDVSGEIRGLKYALEWIDAKRAGNPNLKAAAWEMLNDMQTAYEAAVARLENGESINSTSQIDVPAESPDDWMPLTGPPQHVIRTIDECRRTFGPDRKWEPCVGLVGSRLKDHVHCYALRCRRKDLPPVPSEQDDVLELTDLPDSVKASLSEVIKRKLPESGTPPVVPKTRTVTLREFNHQDELRWAEFGSHIAWEFTGRTCECEVPE